MNAEFKNWVKDNALTLIFSFTTAFSGILFLKFTVDAQGRQIMAQGLEIETIKTDLSKYPSEQYFDLKFKNSEERDSNINKSIEELKNDVKALTNRVNNHIEE